MYISSDYFSKKEENKLLEKWKDRLEEDLKGNKSCV